MDNYPKYARLRDRYDVLQAEIPTLQNQIDATTKHRHLLKSQKPKHQKDQKMLEDLNKKMKVLAKEVHHLKQSSAAHARTRDYLLGEMKTLRNSYGHATLLEIRAQRDECKKQWDEVRRHNLL